MPLLQPPRPIRLDVRPEGARRGASAPLFIFKLLLSLPIGLALVYPFLQTGEAGVFRELELLGPWGAALVGLVFLALVYAYARDLKTCLERVDPEQRVAAPKRVWLMFAIPYNFVEDFFIIHDVARSLRAQAAFNPRLAKFSAFGTVSGWGWCAAQLLSLAPSDAGSLAGLVALVLWVWHWAFIRKAMRALRQ